MNLDKAVFAFAGTMVLLGAALSFFVAQLWLILVAFVGLNMFQAAFTGFCPLTIILKRFGVRPGSVFK